MYVTAPAAGDEPQVIWKDVNLWLSERDPARILLIACGGFQPIPAVRASGNLRPIPGICPFCYAAVALGAGDMHFHVPKPLHGWREFAGEVGIIVLGVLIALGFEQLAEAAHDHIVANHARAAIRAEVGENLWWLQGRKEVEPCVNRRLAQLGRLLEQARGGATFAPIPHLGILPHSKITTRRWEANAQAGRASLFPERELRLLDNMYYTTDQFEEAQNQEETLWSKMRSIEGLRQLTPLDIHDLSIFLAQARYENFIVQLTLVRAQQWADQLHIVAANPGNVEKLNNPNHVSNWVKGSQLCQQLDRRQASDGFQASDVEP